MRLHYNFALVAFLFIAMAGLLYAEDPREQFQQMVEQLQKNPSESFLREKIIRLSREIKPAPVVPEEAIRSFRTGNVYIKESKALAGYFLAISSYKDALMHAPWWGEAYCNLAIAQELAGELNDAITSLKFYLMTAPSDAREAQNRIYEIEAKKELARVDTFKKPLKGKELRILLWSHFVPRFQKEWFHGFAKKWGETNSINITVDHINVAQIPSQTAAEISAGKGHDLIEWIFPPSQFEPSVINVGDVVDEAEKRFGEMHPICKKSSYNPNTKNYYSFCHGWTINHGIYRKSLWENVGKPNGPETWQDLITYGGKIKREQGVPVGIGLSRELKSSMTARALLWSFDSAIQDSSENVILNNENTVAAVRYMADLYREAMTPEVFNWSAVSNNQALIAGRASYIVTSLSAYRSAQKEVPGIAKDIYFTPALKGPRGSQWASYLQSYHYIIPKYSQNADVAKRFLLDMVANYDQAMYASEFYNSPAFFDAPIPLGNRGYPRGGRSKKVSRPPQCLVRQRPLRSSRGGDWKAFRAQGRR